MKYFLNILFVLMMLPFASWAKYVAVLETTADGDAKRLKKITASECVYLTNVFRNEAVRHLPVEQNFTIMTRENIKSMLPPGKSLEECEGSCLAETGRNIAADYVTQARISLVGGSLAISVEIYETIGNKLLASFNGRGDSVEELEFIIKKESVAFFQKVRSGAGYGFAGESDISDYNMGGNFSYQGIKKYVVIIESDPSDAIPTIDGKVNTKCMKTPCSIQLEAGEHRIVASKEHYNDAETLVNITGNKQTVELKLDPNYGTLKLTPKLLGAFGKSMYLKLWVDGIPVDYGNVQLDPGKHSVKIEHRCYNTVEFNATIVRGKTERFSESLKPKSGGLDLETFWEGEPQSVPVYFDGVQVGETPFSGVVPLCAEITVGDRENAELVDVNLILNGSTSLSYDLQKKPKSVILAEQRAKKSSEYNMNEYSQKKYIVAENNNEKNYVEQKKVLNENSSGYVAKPFDLNSEPTQKSSVHWIPISISSVVTVTGVVLAVLGNSNAKKASEEKPSDLKEYEKNREDIKSGQTMRTVGVVTSIVGALGLGISIAF